jgi:hypothetical protein
LFFEIEKNTHQLGLFERRRKGDYQYLQDKMDLVNEKVYYLYYKENTERCLSPGNGDDSRRVSA